MDRLKRIFQCVNPGTDNYSGNSPVVSEMESSSTGPVKEIVPTNLFKNYTQQHRASLAESQAVFEMQKQYLEKRIQYLTLQIEKFDQFKIVDVGRKVLQIEQQCEEIQEKLETLKGDVDWVKFE